MHFFVLLLVLFINLFLGLGFSSVLFNIGTAFGAPFQSLHLKHFQKLWSHFSRLLFCEVAHLKTIFEYWNVSLFVRTLIAKSPVRLGDVLLVAVGTFSVLSQRLVLVVVELPFNLIEAPLT